MTETISQIIRNGFQTWKSNLGIPCISFAWNFIVMMIISMSLITLFLPIFTAPPLSMIFTDPESFMNLTSDEISAMTSEAVRNVSFFDFVIPVLIICVCLILITLVSLFVTGGLYALMRDATRNGKCSYRTFFSECRKNFIRVFTAALVSLVVIFIFRMIVGFFVFMISFVLGLGLGIILAASGSSDPSASLMILSMIIQIPIMIIEFILIYLISFIIYGVVIEQDKNIFDSFNSTFSFIRSNLKDVMILGLIMACIYALLTLFYLIFIFIPVLSLFIWIFIILLLFVIGPLTDIWSVRLYMDRSNMIGTADAGCPAGCSAGPVSGSGAECSDDVINEDPVPSEGSDVSDASGQPETADDGSEKIYVDENGRIVPCGPPDYPELGGYKELKR